jgi:hypothetical protein
MCWVLALIALVAYLAVRAWIVRAVVASPAGRDVPVENRVPKVP